VNGEMKGVVVHDCRRPFKPLTEDECCCTYTVGDGFNSIGDYQKLQDAIDALPSGGGKICLLRGIHEANVIIKDRENVHISGCGMQTLVRPSEEMRAGDVFTVINSQYICLDNFTIISFFGTGIHLNDAAGIASSCINIRDLNILAGKKRSESM